VRLSNSEEKYGWRLIALALAALTLTLFSGSAWGQITGAGSISGTLTDPNGGVVPGATVIVRNSDTGATRDSATNEVGIYTVPFLQPGRPASSLIPLLVSSA